MIRPTFLGLSALRELDYWPVGSPVCGHPLDRRRTAGSVLESRDDAPRSPKNFLGPALESEARAGPKSSTAEWRGAPLTEGPIQPHSMRRGDATPTTATRTTSGPNRRGGIRRLSWFSGPQSSCQLVPARDGPKDRRLALTELLTCAARSIAGLGDSRTITPKATGLVGNRDYS